MWLPIGFSGLNGRGSRAILCQCRWTRQWTAEENRHGDLMNKYCYLSGKVNMKVREARDSQYLAHDQDSQHIELCLMLNRHC